MQQAGEFVEDLGEIRRETGDPLDFRKQCGCILADQRFQQLAHARPLDRAEHRMHLARTQAAAAVGDRLVEQGQAVAQRTIGRPCEHGKGLVLEINAFGSQDVAHLVVDLLGRQALEVELDARESTVTGSFCGSVVASRNLTCGGGSSRSSAAH